MKISCAHARSAFSSYLDGQLTGVTMQRVQAHLNECSGCRSEFAIWREMHSSLGALEHVPPPADLSLRLRVALSNERARTPRNALSSLQVHWKNTLAPFLLQACAGFASAVLLIGTAATLVGMFASPEPVAARDVPLGMATGPRLLYSSPQVNSSAIGDRENPVVVEAAIDGSGRVYDYRIVSGATDPVTRSQVENLLLFSIFEPARFFGQPVRGMAVLSFSGVSVHA